MTAPTTTREAWLHAAIETLRPRFVEIGMPLPETIHVSVGFGFGSKAESKNILGQTWATFASDDNVNHVFVSPEVNDTAEILAILLHELIHVVDDNKHGHRGTFAEAATRLGLEGPMTATHASVELAAEFMCLAATLGDYPHGALSAATRMRTHQPVPVPARRRPRLLRSGEAGDADDQASGAVLRLHRPHHAEVDRRGIAVLPLRHGDAPLLNRSPSGPRSSRTGGHLFALSCIDTCMDTA